MYLINNHLIFACIWCLSGLFGSMSLVDVLHKPPTEHGTKGMPSSPDSHLHPAGDVKDTVSSGTDRYFAQKGFS
jgi:hypothetical protein